MDRSDMATKVFTANDNVKIVADVSGGSDMPTVVMGHGGGQTRHSWSGSAAVLASAGYRVVNYDARGHGDSDWSPDGSYDLANRALDLKAILDDVQGPFALVGASMGGATAMKLVSDGLRPNCLILVDIVPRPEVAGVQRIIDFMSANPDGFASLEEAANAIALYNPDRPRPRNLSGLNRNLRQGNDGRFRWHWDPRIVDRDESTEREEVEESLAGLAKANDVPTLVVRGLHSDVVSDASIAHFRTILPDLEVFEVPGAGHMVAGDRNDRFSQGVLKFLRRHLAV